jgi:gluconokinase
MSLKSEGVEHSREQACGVDEMKRSSWFLGLDLGTGSCKSVVVDEQAEVLGFAVGDYPGAEASDRWQEQDPQHLFAAAVASARSAIVQSGVEAGGCAGLSIGSALHGIMALDRRAEPLTGVITWADGRALEQAEAVRKTNLAARLYQQTGCPAHGMYPLYKIMWLRENRPEVFRKTWRYVSAKEYVLGRLTGEYPIDPSLAAGSGLLNAHTRAWDPLCLETAGIRADQLSPVYPPLTVMEGRHPGLSRHLGLGEDTRIVLGSSDAVNSSLGAGAVFPWQATCMIGTSGALRVICPQPVLDREARSWCYAVDDTHWLVGGAINNGGVALSWLRDCLNQAHPSAPNLSFEDILALAGRAGPGAGGVICLPFFAGERSPHWNLNARAAFLGLSLQHDLAHVCRALVEGIAFRFKNLQAVLTEIGVPVRQVIASGGFTKSEIWLQAVTDALYREIRVPAWSETSCLGAALWSMLAAGLGRSLEDMAGMVQLARSCLPNPETAALYDRIYPLYTRLYRAVGESFDDIARLQRNLAG